MAPSSPLLLSLCFALLFCLSYSQNMYCGDRECYELLEVEPTASLTQIKKNYRRISLKYHPDKNKDPAATKIFQQVAAAYTVLSDKTKRAAYDYYLLHPEDFAYNNAMYYRHVYAPKSDIRLVLFGFIVILSICQYAMQYTRYQQALEYFKKGDKVRRKALEIQYTRSQSKKTVKPKKKSKEQDKKELQEIIDELVSNLHISGGYSKPCVWDLLIVRLALLPITLFKYLKFQISWFIRHTIQKLPYTKEEEIYLTCKALGVSKDLFLSDEFDERRENLIARKLWDDENLDKMKEEDEEEFKRKYPQRYKKMIRMKKGHKSNYGCPDDDED